MADLLKSLYRSLSDNGIKNTLYLACKKIEFEMYKHKWNVPYTRKGDNEIRKPIEYVPHRLNLGIIVSGGLGDYIVSANYIYKLLQRYNPDLFRLYILTEGSFGSSKTVFGGNEIVYRIMKPGDYEYRLTDFDIVIHVSRYPKVKYVSGQRVKNICPEFVEYILLCERFQMENERFFRYLPRLDGETSVYSVMMNDKRMTQPDIYDHLGVTEKYEFQIKMPSEEAVLKKFDLFDKRYIVLHRGGDNNVTNTSVKMWPLSNYSELVDQIRRKYPDLVLVQLGSPLDEKIDADLDYNLVGQTTLEDMKVLSKCCSILIDNEGGIVHLRHALGGGKSIVLFGSTSPEFFGYTENVNMYNSKCPICCEWTVNKWQDKCMRGYPIPPCMESITPEMVMEEVEKLINGGILNE